MRKHTNLLLITWGIISTLAAVFLLNTVQAMKKTNSTLQQSNAVHKKLISNERESYEVIHDCFVVNRGLCNSDEFKKKLESLGDYADELYNQISLLERQMK